MPVSQAELLSLLGQFGHESFRPGQERVIRGLLHGRDALVVMPPGSGRSLLYQLTAQLLPGLTVVVSPHHALPGERGQTAGAGDHPKPEGEPGLLYVTPERFADGEFVARLRRTRVSLVVVDEAHRISEWGSELRPSYLGLGQATADLGHPTVLALAAVATPWIRGEIVERLGMREPDVVVRGVDRPNLFLEARPAASAAEDRRILHDLLVGPPGGYPGPLAADLAGAMRGAGIVYTPAPGAAEATAAWLREWGIAADHYHGRRSRADRERTRRAFASGELRVIAATSAPGPRLDRPDARFVVHMGLPGSLEQYYQQVAVAGQDGQLARCTLIYRPHSPGRAAWRPSADRLTRPEVARAHAVLVERPAIGLEELAASAQLSRADVAHLSSVLARHGLAREHGGQLQLMVSDFDPERVLEEEQARRRAYAQGRLAQMRGYAEAAGCRRRYLLSYFGEELDRPHCGLCDRDALIGDSAEERATAGPQPPGASFSVGEAVVHEGWGPGVVQRVEDTSVTVLFERVGPKTLATDVVLQRGLLRPAA